MLAIALKSTLVLAAALLITTALRKRSAALRHLILTAALASILALPFLSISLPALRVPAPATGFIFQTTVTASPPLESPRVPSAQSVPAQPPKTSFNWRAALTLIWIAGTTAAFLRILTALIALWRMRRNAILSCDPELPAIEILEAAPGTMPMAFGIFRPTIILPADADQWTPDRRSAVLLHEFAHIQRHDPASQLLARVAGSLYWWNPLAWLAWKQFLKEQERAADDLVLASGTRASDYAGHLLDIARTMRSKPALLSVAMARPSQLEGRLAAILDSTVNRQNPGRATAVLTAISAIVLMLPLAAASPQSDSMPLDVDATIRAAISQRNNDILDSAAKAAEQARKYDIARTLLDSAATIRAQVSGEQSAEYAIGLLKLGDLEAKRNNDDSAADFYTRAIQILGSRPESGPALKYLGIRALSGNLDQAFDYFDKAAHADPSLAASASTWMAVVRQRQKRMDEAESLFRDALYREGNNSPDAVPTMKLLAQLLRAQNRVEEADAMEARAKEAQVINVRPPAPGVYRVGNGVSAPAVLTKVDPEYSETARLAKLSGTVTLLTEIGPDGLAHNISVTRKLGFGLDEKAIEAVEQWHFKPGTKDGQPVTVTATIEVNFRLN